MSNIQVRFKVKLALCVTFLFVLAMLVYRGSTENVFVWDSIRYLFEYREHISSLNIENLWWMATSLSFSNWHPLTWFSYALDYQLYGGLDMWGFHFSNNILHAINGGLLFVLILTCQGLVFPRSSAYEIRKDNHAIIAALLAASLFVVHPQNVESVAWVAERKNLLCQLFLLLSLLSYVKYVTCSQLSKTKWYVFTLGLFFLAVLSKPMAVTFPAVLLLIDVYPLRRTGLLEPTNNSVWQRSYLRLLVEKIPFFLLTLILVVTTIVAQDAAIFEVPFFQKAVNAVHSTILYLVEFLVPVALNPHHSYFRITDTASAVMALVMLLLFAGITLATIIAWRKNRPAWLIAWFFYLGTLVPVLGLIQVGAQGAADRYAYLPTLPIYMLLAAGMFLVLQKRHVVMNTVLYFVALSVITLFSLQTSRQIGVWKNESSLWEYVIKVDPENMFAHNNLGVVYKNKADYEHAALLFEAGDDDSYRPDSMRAWRAVTYMHLGRYEESIEYLVKLGILAENESRLVVDEYCIQYNLGWNYAHLNMYLESADLFGRVAKDSHLFADATTWLDEIAKQKFTDDILSLPGICENLILSRAKAQEIR